MKRTDDAAIGLAIPLEVDTAIGGRVVLCVDEVKVLAKAAPFGIPDAVSPCRDAGEVVLRVVAQQLLEVRCRVVLDEIARDVGDGDMTQTYPTTISKSRVARSDFGGTAAAVALTTPGDRSRQD